MINAKFDLTVAKVAGGRLYEINGNAQTDVVWLDGNPAPAQTEWDIAESAVIQEFAIEAARQSRAAEYPTVQEQMDMMYHDLVEGTTKWVDMVRSIKSKYPK